MMRCEDCGTMPIPGDCWCQQKGASVMGKASKERARQEYREVKNYVYKTRGSDDNPYSEGSRKHRFWAKAYRYYWQMEYLLGYDD